MRTNVARTGMILGAAMLLIATHATPARAEAEKLEVKIVKDALVEKGGVYHVEGVVYNPNKVTAKNVVIKYYVWKKLLGQDGHGPLVKEKGGLLVATVKTLPAKQSTEFSATGGSNAPVLPDLVPEPLDAQTSAEWSK